MTNFDRITVNPNRMNGQPCIRDLRLTVRRAGTPGALSGPGRVAAGIPGVAGRRHSAGAGPCRSLARRPHC